MHEGVIQFELRHTEESLGVADERAVEALMGWRTILRQTGLLGEEPERYDGLGFGNVSHRVGPRSAPRGRRAFIVSGSQTSGMEHVTADEFARVEQWTLEQNRVHSRGPVPPSSESLTHATVYDCGPHIGAVLHVHSPDIWKAHRRLALPTTPHDIPYGTVAMARATADLLRSGRVFDVGAYVMLGHEDGVVAFGRTVDEAGTILMTLLARART